MTGWTDEARQAVEKAIHLQVPNLERGPLGTEYVATAVLEALEPHVLSKHSVRCAIAVVFGRDSDTDDALDELRAALEVPA